MSHEALETYLEQEGYQLTSTETSFSIYLKQEVNRVVLNEQLKYKADGFEQKGLQIYSV